MNLKAMRRREEKERERDQRIKTKIEGWRGRLVGKGTSHEFNALTCKTDDFDNDPVVALDVPDLDQLDNEFTLQERYDMYHNEVPFPANYGKTSQYMIQEPQQATSSEIHETGRGKRAVEEFFQSWMSIEKQQSLEHDINNFFLAVEKNEQLKRYHLKFAKARLDLVSIPKEGGLSLLLQFIKEASYESFENFDILVKGAVWANRGTSFQLFQKVLQTLSDQTSTIVHDAKDISETAKNYESLSESLRESCNIIAASTKKLEAEMKKIEISQIDAIPKPIIQERPLLRTEAKVVQCYNCGDVYLAITPENKLDGSLTETINKERISIQDRPVISTMSLLGKRALATVANATWSEMKQFHPLDATLSPQDKLNKFWAAFKRKYPVAPELKPVDVHFNQVISN